MILFKQNFANSTKNTTDGHYIYFESDKFEIDYWINDGVDVTRIKSPFIDGNKKQCLEFWYHMNGK